MLIETKKSQKVQNSSPSKNFILSTLNSMKNSGKIDQTMIDSIFANSSGLSKKPTKTFKQEDEDSMVKPEYKIQLKGDLNFYLQKQRFNKKIIEETEEFIKPLKKEMKKLVKLRLIFLKTLLKNGKDYR